MHQFISWEVAHQGEQVAGPQHHALDATRSTTSAFKAARGELDPVKRAALFIKMNDLVVSDHGGHPGRLPAARRGDQQQAACAASSGWDSDFWNLQDWYREA